jgi:hypothetical protein
MRWINRLSSWDERGGGVPRAELGRIGENDRL